MSTEIKDGGSSFKGRHIITTEPVSELAGKLAVAAAATATKLCPPSGPACLLPYLKAFHNFKTEATIINYKMPPKWPFQPTI